MESKAVDFSRLLENVPKGAWVAISHDETRVVSYSSQLDDAIRKAHDAGEEDPIILRVPETTGALLL